MTLEPITRGERVGLVIALLLAAILMWPLRDHITDTTYVHLRFARNLADGNGLVFNPGERVYGCTSPLWVTLLADAMMLGWDGLVTARALGFIATLLSVVFFFELMRRSLRQPSMRALATVAWASHAWMLEWSLSGVETPLAVALMLAGFVTFTSGPRWGSRPLATGALWALAALTRPTFVLLILLWGILLLIDTNNRAGVRRLLLGMAPVLLILGSWTIFAQFYYGTVWPRLHPVFEERTARQLVNVWREIQVLGETDGVLAGLLGLALVFSIHEIWPRVISAQRLLPWAWIATLPVFLVARGIPATSRTLLPLVPILGWLAWRGADGWWLGRTPDTARRAQATVFALAVATIVVFQNLMIYRSVVLPEVRHSSAEVGVLADWGQWFNRHGRRDAVIATRDIGAIGFFSQRKILDLSGRMSPAMERYVKRESPSTAVEQFRFAFARPSFLVDRSARRFDLLERSPYGACLRPLGSVRAATPVIARPDSLYSIYFIQWSVFDTHNVGR